MGCKQLTYPTNYFLGVVHPQKRATEQKKCVRHYNYVYQYKDHLGNIRLSYKDISLTSTPSLQIVEENNYYPFGLKHKGYNMAINGTHHKYMFGGKEFDESFGGTLNTYDFGARNYDPALGRWMNIDPLSEQMRRHSPYNYAFDNPIYFIDPDGMAPMAGDGIDENDWKKKGNGFYEAEKGDSAATLAKDANISDKEANAIVESQLGKNYKGADGQIKSDVEVGDKVVVAGEYVAAMENKAAINDLQKEITTDKTTIAKNNNDKDSIQKIVDKTTEQLEMHDITGAGKPTHGDPKTGVSIWSGYKQNARESKIRAEKSKINKINKTNDSLGKENDKKKEQIRNKGY